MAKAIYVIDTASKKASVFDSFLIFFHWTSDLPDLKICRNHSMVPLL